MFILNLFTIMGTKCKVVSDIYANSFNYELDQFSPVVKDEERIVERDSAGNEKIRFQEVDYKKLESERGSVFDYSLKALLAAGVDPAFPVHTGINSRIEAAAQVSEVAAEVDNFFTETDKK